jgi:hypothetical protein
MDASPLGQDVVSLVSRIRAGQERMEHDIKDLKFRVGQIEQTLAHHSSRFDGAETRLEQIEKALVSSMPDSPPFHNSNR